MNQLLTESKPLRFTYPTMAMQSVIDNIRTSIRFMRDWYDAPRERDPQKITEVTQVTVIATFAAVIESSEPALRFFLNYPTQRLLVILITFLDEAKAFVQWLNMYGGPSQEPSLNPPMYAQACEKSQTSLRDWRNAIVLAGIAVDLDTEASEILH